MKNKDPLISIVMPAYNSASFISEGITSILRQTVDDWELIIVDDRSADSTVEVAERFSREDARITVLKQSTNQGAALARNRAIEHATGRFIAFLDSDDLWYPDKLRTQIKILSESDAIMCFTGYDVIDLENNDQIIRTISAPHELRYEELLKGDPIGCLTVMYDREKTGTVFMPKIRQRQDWGLWLRLLRNGGYGLGISKTLGALRVRKGSLSSNKLRSTYYNWLLLRTEGQLSPIKAASGVTAHLFDAVRRRVSGKDSFSSSK